MRLPCPRAQWATWHACGPSPRHLAWLSGAVYPPTHAESQSSHDGCDVRPPAHLVRPLVWTVSEKTRHPINMKILECRSKFFQGFRVQGDNLDLLLEYNPLPKQIRNVLAGLRARRNPICHKCIMGGHRTMSAMGQTPPKFGKVGRIKRHLSVFRGSSMARKNSNSLRDRYSNQCSGLSSSQKFQNLPPLHTCSYKLQINAMHRSRC